MTEQELLGTVADLINSGKRLHDDFKRARRMTDQDFLSGGNYCKVELMERLRYCYERGKHYAIGWWYGRYTDPRWNRKVI